MMTGEALASTGSNCLEVVIAVLTSIQAGQNF